jgi:flagellar motor switch protein FliM
LIDVLLGGDGQNQEISRDLTEIEEHVIEGIGRVICQEIATAWGLQSSECVLVGARAMLQVQRVLSPNDKVVVSPFHGKMADTTGSVRLIIPEMTFNVLLRRLANDANQVKPPKSPSLGLKMAEKLLECTFPVSPCVTAIQLPVDQILGLAPGNVCDLGVPLNRPAAFIISGRETFDANPVRQGRKRGAQVGQSRMNSLQEKTE